MPAPALPASTSASPSPRLLVLAFVIAVTLLAGMLQLRGVPFLPINPNYQVAQYTKALVERGSFERDDNRALYEELQQRSRENPGKAYWQDVFSLGKGGELYPVRGALMSVAGAGFYALGGTVGLWLFNQLCLLVILAACFSITRHWTSRPAACVTTILIFFGTRLFLMSYSYSYDLFGCALIFGGLLLMHRRPFWGSLLVSLAVETRPTNLLLLPLVLYGPLRSAGSDEGGRRIAGRRYAGRRYAGRIAAGLAAGLLAVGVGNYAMWGSPFTVSYERMARFKDGEAFVHETHSRPSLSVLRERWGEKLFGEGVGLFRAHPLLLLAPFGLVLSLRSRARRAAALFGLLSLLYGVVIYSLPSWEANANAVRYLLPAVLLLCLPNSLLVERVRRRERATRQQPA